MGDELHREVLEVLVEALRRTYTCLMWSILSLARKSGSWSGVSYHLGGVNTRYLLPSTLLPFAASQGEFSGKSNHV